MDKMESTPWHLVNPTHLPMGFHGNNIGDDIQTEAARLLWPDVRYLHRDSPNEWPEDARVPMIGWFGHSTSPFPTPAKNYIVGFHCAPHVADCLVANRDWLKECVKWQGFPAFCRDLYTRDLIRKMGIEAEFGGCVTLTLPRYNGARDGEIDIDFPHPYGGGSGGSHIAGSRESAVPGIRLQFARLQMDKLRTSSLVRTTRLHAWLPSLALGTKSIMDISRVQHNLFRFFGYNDRATTLEELFEGRDDPNASVRLAPRKSSEFAGFMDFPDVH